MPAHAFGAVAAAVRVEGRLVRGAPLAVATGDEAGSAGGERSAGTAALLVRAEGRPERRRRGGARGIHVFTLLGFFLKWLRGRLRSPTPSQVLGRGLPEHTHPPAHTHTRT